MNSKYTNQHTVPRCYLRQFSFGKEKNPKVYVYDKIPHKPRVAPIKDICCEPDIYTLSKLSEEGANMNEEERKKKYEVDYLKKQVEDYFGPCLEYTVSKLEENKTLTIKEKMDLSHFIAIQYLRHPIIKPFCSHIQNGLFSDIDRTKALISEYEKDNPHVMNYYYDDAQAHFNNGYGNVGTINQLTCLFGLARWDVLYSTNNICTSDNPVLVIPNKFEIHTNKVVLGKKTHEFLFPISKDYLLTVEIDPDASFYQNNLCIVRDASEMDLLRYNLFQFLYCQRYVIKHTPLDNQELKYITTIQNTNTLIYE